MVKLKYSSFVILVLIVVCIVFSSCGLGEGDVIRMPFGNGPEADEEDLPEPAVEEWVLPIIVAVTGNDSDFGRAAAWGFDYGIKTVNEQGGIRGLPVKMAIRDVASSDLEVVTEINIAAAEGAIAIMGPPTKDLYEAGEATFFSAKLPAVGAATDRNARESNRPYAISCITEPSSETISAVESWVRAEQFKKVCIFSSPIYSDRNAYAEATFIAGGVTIVEKFELGNEAFDAASIAEKAFFSGADAYYIDTNGEDTLRIIRQLKFLAGEEEANNLKILCGPQAANKEFVDSAEEGELPGVRVWATQDPNKNMEKRRVFEDAFNKSIDNASLFDLTVDYCQSALMLKQAIDKLGPTGDRKMLAGEREALAEYLYDSDVITTDQGDFITRAGNKLKVASLYKITENGFE